MTGYEKAEAPLSGYRILDLADEKGFYCGQLLGNLGADVVKIEKPCGDAARRRGPFYKESPGTENSLFWLAFNNNKRGITLDLETADGRSLFQRLAQTADIIIETSRPGYLNDVGLDYSVLEKVNPRLIMVSITPFGQDGPHSGFNASDLVCWAMGGLLFVTGDADKPPVHVGSVPLSYLLAGMDGASAAAMSLYWRGLSGQGQHIDVSIQDAALKTAWMVHEIWCVTGKEFQRGSSRYSVPGSPVRLRMTWPAKDGYVMYLIYVGAFGAEEDKRLVKWLDDEGLADDFIRGIHWGTLDWRTKTIEDAEKIQDYFVRLFQSKPKDELVAEAIKRGVQMEVVSTPKDILKHPQFEARDYWQDVPLPALGTSLRFPARFCQFSEAPTKVWRSAPRLGEHNEEIYSGEFGISRQDLTILREAGAI